MENKNKLGLIDRVDVVINRGKRAASSFKPRGVFTIEHLRKQADGTMKKIAEYEAHNDVTNGGKDNALDVLFDAATQITTWYMGLVNNSGFTGFADADTMASHAGWTEFITYSQAARVTIVFEAASGQAISNSVTAATFDITASGTLHGIFVTSGSAKSGTTGTLWATAAFAANIPVANTDQLKITYTVSAT